VPSVGRFFRSARLVDFSPDQMRFLNWGRVVDTSLLKSEFGFTPRWTTRQAFDDYVSGRGLRPLITPERVEAIERGLLDAAAKLR
jgi:UDP-glucose 4-epimerase